MNPPSRCRRGAACARLRRIRVLPWWNSRLRVSRSRRRRAKSISRSIPPATPPRTCVDARFSPSATCLRAARTIRASSAVQASSRSAHWSTLSSRPMAADFAASPTKRLRKPDSSGALSSPSRIFFLSFQYSNAATWWRCCRGGSCAKARRCARSNRLLRYRATKCACSGMSARIATPRIAGYASRSPARCSYVRAFRRGDWLLRAESVADRRRSGAAEPRTTATPTTAQGCRTQALRNRRSEAPADRAACHDQHRRRRANASGKDSHSRAHRAAP